jgi:hypothetical protein
LARHLPYSLCRHSTAQDFATLIQCWRNRHEKLAYPRHRRLGLPRRFEWDTALPSVDTLVDEARKADFYLEAGYAHAA